MSERLEGQEMYGHLTREQAGDFFLYYCDLLRSIKNRPKPPEEEEAPRITRQTPLIRRKPAKKLGGKRR